MNSSDYYDIYHHLSEQYELLVSREDYEGNILPALKDICNLRGRVVLELGAGTGRLTRQIVPYVDAIFGFDISPSMIEVARRQLIGGDWANWALAVADHRHLPLSTNSADLIISGWSLCYLALDQDEAWRVPLRKTFAWLGKLLRPGGIIIILETMGTGHTSPHPPGFMLDYFSFLQEMGFQSSWIRTDYKYESVSEAVYLTRFFFGEELADEVEKKASRFLPECTGIWWVQDADRLA